MKPSPTQLDVLRVLAREDSPLLYVKGGFWTYEGCPMAKPGVPEWFVTVGTIRALKKRGWVADVGLPESGRHPAIYAERWVLTKAGREALGV